MLVQIRQMTSTFSLVTWLLGETPLERWDLITWAQYCLDNRFDISWNRWQPADTLALVTVTVDITTNHNNHSSLSNNMRRDKCVYVWHSGQLLTFTLVDLWTVDNQPSHFLTLSHSQWEWLTHEVSHFTKSREEKHRMNTLQLNCVIIMYCL